MCRFSSSCSCKGLCAYSLYLSSFGYDVSIRVIHASSNLNLCSCPVLYQLLLLSSHVVISDVVVTAIMDGTWVISLVSYGTLMSPAPAAKTVGCLSYILYMAHIAGHYVHDMI